MWLYGSGFPKSQNLGNAVDKKNGIDNRTGNYLQGMGSNNTESMNNHKYNTQNYKKQYEERKATNRWQGWGTCLKPSFEPIIVARKPFKGSLVDNVIENGVGGINIDECRVEPTGEDIGRNNHKNPYGNDRTWKVSITPTQDTTGRYEGRFPANTILTYDDTDFDEVCGGFPNTKNKNTKGTYSGSASRYFYCAKASKKDRDEGLEAFETKGAKELLNREENSDGASWNGKYSSGNAYAGSEAPKKNTHPTVKPTELMQYLIRLVSPKGATILDPFMREWKYRESSNV